MTEAWSSVTTIEPEWTTEARNEALAHVQVRALTCQRCGQRGALVEVRNVEFDRVDWAAHGYPRRFQVGQYRCLACASVEAVQHAFEKAVEDRKGDVRSEAAGRRWVAHEIPRPK